MILLTDKATEQCKFTASPWIRIWRQSWAAKTIRCSTNSQDPLNYSMRPYGLRVPAPPVYPMHAPIGFPSLSSQTAHALNGSPSIFRLYPARLSTDPVERRERRLRSLISMRLVPLPSRACRSNPPRPRAELPAPPGS